MHVENPIFTCCISYLRLLLHLYIACKVRLYNIWRTLWYYEDSPLTRISLTRGNEGCHEWRLRLVYPSRE